MKLSGRRAGSLTTFVDTSREEVLLQILADEQSRPLIAYTLYDAGGQLVATSPDPKPYPNGLSVKTADEELLLDVPADLDGSLTYRLYNHTGHLLTVSDGKRTQIFGHLRMDGNKIGANQRRPAAVAAEPEASAVDAAVEDVEAAVEPDPVATA
jgi:hypothetical protein